MNRKAEEEKNITGRHMEMWLPLVDELCEIIMRFNAQAGPLVEGV